MKNKHAYTLGLRETDKTMIAAAGGKGANLGELFTIEGIQVPEGFCITTEACKAVMDNNEILAPLLNQLDVLNADDRMAIGETCAKIRAVIESFNVPQVISEEVADRLATLGEKDAYAVRSSATAEDLPAASFAGQQDTWLNITGTGAILKHISKCWASLFTDRAVIYRIRHGFEHRKVQLAVIIQKMVFPQASGIMFTADPVTGNRKVLSIDAGFGLGEALVSGMVNADVYKVRDGRIVDKKISGKTLAIYAAQDGGTIKQDLAPEMQHRQALTDEQILQLEDIGRRIEKHFGYPQDIEWCLADDVFYIVQGRPVTALYPIPEANDQENHVYVSVGHQQMMTDAMKPLGISIWNLTSARPMFVAGGRLFVDVAPELASPARKNILVNVLGKSDPLIKDALTTILERGSFIQSLPEDGKEPGNGKDDQSPPPRDFQALNDYDPGIVGELIRNSEAATAALKQEIQTKSGPALMDFILENMRVFRQRFTDPRSFNVIMTGMNAASWLNEKMNEWLGEKSVADMLSQSVHNNITSEMGLALLDVADAIRPYPEVIRYLQQVKEDNISDALAALDGGIEVSNAISSFLTKYGMRCAGEIDITRPRWSEKPAALVPVILSNIKNFEPGESRRRFERGRQEALKKEQELLDRLQRLPDGAQKAAETKRMIGLVRNLAGYREYPKYSIISRYFIYRQALLKEAGKLLQAGIISEKEDIYYLSFEELCEVVRTHKADQQLIVRRKEEYRLYEKLVPPRVITSEGEILTGAYRRENLPAGAIIGLPVSSGIIEGRARVIRNMEDAALEEGDILVTPFTDPSWTPLFVSIKGLVTEVGGLMTHGAVIAREYGLPAIVGVENATRLIKDGQRIRLNGTDGYVEILQGN